MSRETTRSTSVSAVRSRTNAIRSEMTAPAEMIQTMISATAHLIGRFFTFGLSRGAGTWPNMRRIVRPTLWISREELGEARRVLFGEELSVRRHREPIEAMDHHRLRSIVNRDGRRPWRDGDQCSEPCHANLVEPVCAQLKENAFGPPVESDHHPSRVKARENDLI